MRASPSPVHRAARIVFFVALAPLGLGTATAIAAGAAPANATTAAPKTHVLFMGADITVEKDKEFHRVEDVTASSLIIKPAGKPVAVPQLRGLDLRINESLKIARTNVGISRLKTERAYTPDADPFRKLAAVSHLAASQSAATDLARGTVLTLQTQGAGGPTGGTMGAALAAAEGAVDAANLESSRQIYDTGSHAVQAGTEEARELFDAIRFSFEVTPERDLEKPYYAVIALIRDRDSKPGQVRKWAYVKSLDAINAGEPKKVSVLQGGLPSGYILESCEVHLYNQGEEVATNLSRRRVPLSEDEALEYRIIEYVGANKGRTLPAALATTLTSDLRAQLGSNSLSETHHVRVAKNGRVVGVFRDAAGRQPRQDARLEAALQTLRFKPALQAGKPVESVVALNLSQLSSP